MTPTTTPTRRWWAYSPALGPSTGLVGLLGLAGFGLVAARPAHLSEEGPVLCPSRLLTGLPCPGCGMVRACTYLVHWDMGAVVHFNPFAFAVASIVASMVLVSVVRAVQRRPMLPFIALLSNRAGAVLAACWGVWGVLRMVLVATGRWPNIA